MKLPFFKEYLLFIGSDCYIFSDDTLIDGWLHSTLIKNPDLNFKRKMTFENENELHHSGYKLLLRPMSSITAEEKKKYYDIVGELKVDKLEEGKIWMPTITKGLAYLISKDFDIFNWIEETKALDKTHLDFITKK